MVKPKPVFILAALLLLHHGLKSSTISLFILFSPALTLAGSATWCETSTPTVQQTRVGFGDPPRFAVVIKNSCAMCPAIEIHLRCGGLPQRLVNPKLLRVVGPDDCVVNDNLPLGPLQKISFSYTHQRFRLSPKSWYYQCE